MAGVTSGKCRDCDEGVQINEIFCPHCWRFDDFPNVKLARAKRQALFDRESDARNDAFARRAVSELIWLEQLSDQAVVVVGMGVGVLWSMLKDRRMLYLNYERAMNAQYRRPASPENSAQRAMGASAVGGPEISTHAIYAAVSSNGFGPVSYGPIGVTLKLPMIAHRVSLLEENSYSFRQKYLDNEPPGYRAVWQDRTLLTVAKLARLLYPGATETDLRRMILASNGSRPTDVFMEAHIYGTFTHRAFARVVVMADPEPPDDEHDLERAKAYALAAGILWDDRR